MEFPILLQAVTQPFVFCPCFPYGEEVIGLQRMLPSLLHAGRQQGGWKATIRVERRAKHIGWHTGPCREKSGRGELGKGS